MSGPLLVILKAPQGCGKTTVAADVARAFGCDRIHDDELNERAIALDVFRCRRVLVCTSGDYPPINEFVPTLRLTVEGEQPAKTLHELMKVLGHAASEVPA